MTDERAESQSQSPEPAPGDRATKKPYEAPQLVEYGDIAQLTRTGGITMSDGTGKRVTRVG